MPEGPWHGPNPRARDVTGRGMARGGEGVGGRPSVEPNMPGMSQTTYHIRNRTASDDKKAANRPH